MRNFYKLYPEVFTDPNLKIGIQTHVFTILLSYHERGYPMFKSNTEFAKECNVNLGTLKNTLSYFEKIKYIERYFDQGKRYIVIHKDCSHCITSKQESYPQGVTEKLPPVTEKLRDRHASVTGGSRICDSSPSDSLTINRSFNRKHNTKPASPAVSSLNNNKQNQESSQNEQTQKHPLSDTDFFEAMLNDSYFKASKDNGNQTAYFLQSKHMPIEEAHMILNYVNDYKHRDGIVQDTKKLVNEALDLREKGKLRYSASYTREWDEQTKNEQEHIDWSNKQKQDEKENSSEWANNIKRGLSWCDVLYADLPPKKSKTS